MRYYIALILLCLVVVVPRVSFSDEQSPAQQASPSALTHQKEPKESPGKTKTLHTEAISYNDFSDLDLSTPKKSVISFVNLYNGVMPVSPITDLQEICIKVAQPAYQEKCVVLFGERLSYLKAISKPLKGVYCVPQSLKKDSDSPVKFTATWKEQITFTDMTTQLTSMTMSVFLEKSDKDWRVIKVENQALLTP